MDLPAVRPVRDRLAVGGRSEAPAVARFAPRGRCRYRRGVARANTITSGPDELAAVGPFFAAETVAAARIQRLIQIPKPSFYSMLDAQGIPRPLDFSQAAGLTLIDCILIAASQVGPRPIARELLFHELVHVVQYRHLGPEEFIRRYVRGLMENRRAYAWIPAGVEARALSAFYESGRSARSLRPER